MAFMDKLSELKEKGEALAKNAAEKANDFVAAKKMDIKIASEESEIKELKAQIGEIYWQKYLAGESLDLEASELCGQIQQHLNDIEMYKNMVNDENSAPAGAKFCQNCGEPLGEGAKFCPKCGMQA